MALRALIDPLIGKVRDALERPADHVWVAEGVSDGSAPIFLGCFATETAAWRAGNRAKAYDNEVFEVRVFETKVFSDLDRYAPAVFLD